MTELKDKNTKKPKMTFKDAATKVLEAVKKAKEALAPSRKRKASEMEKTPEKIVEEVVAHLQEKEAARESNSGDRGNNKPKKRSSKGGFTL